MRESTNGIVVTDVVLSTVAETYYTGFELFVEIYFLDIELDF